MDGGSPFGRKGVRGPLWIPCSFVVPSMQTSCRAAFGLAPVPLDGGVLILSSKFGRQSAVINPLRKFSTGGTGCLACRRHLDLGGAGAEMGREEARAVRVSNRLGLHSVRHLHSERRGSFLIVAAL